MVEMSSGDSWHLEEFLYADEEKSTGIELGGRNL
jgi:hypothetical protein